MPIHLTAPRGHPPGAPEVYTPPAQCALRPTSYPSLVESQDTRRARWGSFGPCTREGHCIDCPVLTRTRPMLAVTRDVFVWVDERNVPHLVDKPEDPATRVERTSWARLAKLPGWTIGGQGECALGEGFWIHAPADAGQAPS